MTFEVSLTRKYFSTKTIQVETNSEEELLDKLFDQVIEFDGIDGYEDKLDYIHPIN